MSNLAIKIGNLELNNPVILASGTCGPQLKNFTNISKLGAIISPQFHSPFETANQVIERLANSD